MATAAVVVACTAACSAGDVAAGERAPGTSVQRLLLRAIHTSPSSPRLWAMLARMLVVEASRREPVYLPALRRAASTAQCAAAAFSRRVPGAGAEAGTGALPVESPAVFRALSIMLHAAQEGPGSTTTSRVCTRAAARLVHTHPNLAYAWELLASSRGDGK